MNHTYKILKYLYKNNDGEYHPVQHAYIKNKLPSREMFWDKIRELQRIGYLEHKSKHDFIDLLDRDRKYPMPFGTLPDNKHTLYQIKIISKGESYIDDRTIKVFKWIIQKRNFWVYSISVIAIVVSTIINLIFRFLLK